MQKKLLFKGLMLCFSSSCTKFEKKNEHHRSKLANAIFASSEGVCHSRSDVILAIKGDKKKSFFSVR